MLTESLIISLAGGAAGVGLAAFINHTVRNLRLPTEIALLFDLRVDWRVLTFTLVLSVATGILFSLIPALQSSKPQLVPALKDESSMAGFRRSRLRNALVVAQVSLSLVLLISAGLIVRGLQAAQKVRPGFNPENRVALSFDVVLQGYDESRGKAFYQQVLERARSLPQIESVAMTDNLPLGLHYNSSRAYIEGAEFTSVSNLPGVVPMAASPGYFDVMGIPLRGRDFRLDEDKKESRAAVVNETFARRFYPGQDAIGKRFNFSGPNDPFWEIVGVVPDGKYTSLGEDPKPAVYTPLFRNYEGYVTLIARTRGDAHGGAERVTHRRATARPATTDLQSEDAHRAHGPVALSGTRRCDRARQLRPPRAHPRRSRHLRRMSHVVAGRTREIGLRMALGAQLFDVQKLIVRQGMWLAAIGSIIGLAVALGGARLLKSFLYGVSATDPITFTFIAFLLLAIAFLACWIPARRASRVDPMIALRAE